MNQRMNHDIRHLAFPKAFTIAELLIATAIILLTSIAIL